MRSLNPDARQSSCRMYPCNQLHNSPLRPTAHGHNFQNCWWYVMEIKEKELDKSWWRCEANYIKNKWMDPYVINCQLKALKRNGPTLFITQKTCIVVGQKQTSLKPFGCKSLYIETLYGLSIMAVCILHTIVEHPIAVSISLRWVSMERQRFLVLHHWQSKCCIVTLFQRGSIGWLYM